MSVVNGSLKISLHPQTAGLSLRRNFAWVLSGNVVYALCQWGMIIVLAKLSNPLMVGQFSLGLAISTPVLMFANLHLRAVQATDVERRYQFGDYLGLRTVTTLAALAAIAWIAWMAGYEHGTAMVVLAVGVAKSIEALSDVFYGLFQLNDHLDQTGMSMMLKGVFSVMALSAGLYLTGDVFWGVVALALAWLALLFLFDTRRGRRFLRAEPDAGGWSLRPRYNFKRQWKLAGLALPLGVVMTLVSLNLNMPRYFVHSHLGETKLGVFSTMAYAMVGVATVIDAMGHSAIPKLSRFYASGQLDAFRSLLFKLVGLGSLMGLIGMSVVLAAGDRLLTVLYGSEYAGYADVFAWLMAGAGLGGVASLLSYGIISARCFRAQVPMFAVIAGGNALVCSRLVPSLGLTGAAMAVLIASALHLALAAVILAHVLLSASKDTRRASDRTYSDHWEPSL